MCFCYIQLGTHMDPTQVPSPDSTTQQSSSAKPTRGRRGRKKQQEVPVLTAPTSSCSVSSPRDMAYVPESKLNGVMSWIFISIDHTNWNINIHQLNVNKFYILQNDRMFCSSSCSLIDLYNFVLKVRGNIFVKMKSRINNYL